MTQEERDIIAEKQFTKKESSRHKKPKFKRQESWRYKRVGDTWRKPRGIDSKMRKKIKGWPPSPGSGYRGPKKTRGIHPSGFVETRVQSLEDLDEVNPELQAIRIAHTVGGKKRVDILSLAERKGIHVLNPRGVQETKEFQESMDLEEIEETKSLSEGEK